MVVNTSEMHLEISCEELAEADIRIQNQYVVQQNLDAYSHIVEHADMPRMQQRSMKLEI